MNKYFDIQQRMRSCKGFEVYCQIVTLMRTEKLFLRNHEELTAHLRKHSTSQSLITYWGPAKKSLQEAEFDELIRLTHNYFASAKTMVDHSRVSCRALLNGKELNVYEVRVKSEFGEDPFCNFVQNLRNYIQHMSHPAFSVKFDNVARRIGYQVSVQEIAEWSGWNARALIYVRSLKGPIFIEDITASYTPKVDALNRWVVSHIQNANSQLLDELSQINEELRCFCQAEGIPTTEGEWRAYNKRASPP